jgi:hypothetical protein
MYLRSAIATRARGLCRRLGQNQETSQRSLTMVFHGLRSLDAFQYPCAD